MKYFLVQKKQNLQTMADELLKNSKKILAANNKDLITYKDLDLTPAFIDR